MNQSTTSLSLINTLLQHALIALLLASLRNLYLYFALNFTHTQTPSPGHHSHQGTLPQHYPRRKAFRTQGAAASGAYAPALTRLTTPVFKALRVQDSNNLYSITSNEISLWLKLTKFPLTTNYSTASLIFIFIIKH